MGKPHHHQQRSALQSKVTEGEIDLSADGLTVVPIKDLALLPQVSTVDLSRNRIARLPDSFGELTHIVRLDLSKNLLESLPESFGNLIYLKKLDLFGNKLRHLPFSFGQLKALQWLDLKDNELDQELGIVAGTCANEAECKKCAKQIVSFLAQQYAEAERIAAQKERDRQRNLEINAERAARAQELAKKQKAAEKEARRKAQLETKASMAPVDHHAETLDGTSTSLKKVRHSGPSKWLICSMVCVPAILIIAFLSLVLAFDLRVDHTLPTELSRLFNHFVALNTK